MQRHILPSCLRTVMIGEVHGLLNSFIIADVSKQSSSSFTCYFHSEHSRLGWLNTGPLSSMLIEWVVGSVCPSLSVKLALYVSKTQERSACGSIDKSLGKRILGLDSSITSSSVMTTLWMEMSWSCHTA